MNGWALFLELLLGGEGRLVHRNGPGDRHGEQEKAPDKKIKKYNETFTEYLFKICFSTSKVKTQSLGIHQIQMKAFTKIFINKSNLQSKKTYL